MRAQLRILPAIVVILSISCASLPARRQSSSVKPTRAGTPRTAVLAQAQVWRSTDVRGVDVIAGPRVPGAFARNETITCEYLDKKLGGLTPKFACKLPDGDE